jgi:hypothetical protein
MTITTRPRWSLGRGDQVVPSRWQATPGNCWAQASKPVSETGNHIGEVEEQLRRISWALARGVDHDPRTRNNDVQEVG